MGRGRAALASVLCRGHGQVRHTEEACGLSTETRKSGFRRNCSRVSAYLQSKWRATERRRMRFFPNPLPPRSQRSREERDASFIVGGPLPPRPSLCARYDTHRTIAVTARPPAAAPWGPPSAARPRPQGTRGPPARHAYARRQTASHAIARWRESRQKGGGQLGPCRRGVGTWKGRAAALTSETQEQHRTARRRAEELAQLSSPCTTTTSTSNKQMSGHWPACVAIRPKMLSARD